eukprot:6015718-Amphidinium_carterae.2
MPPPIMKQAKSPCVFLNVATNNCRATVQLHLPKQEATTSLLTKTNAIHSPQMITYNPQQEQCIQATKKQPTEDKSDL